jgi:hypothetical protein
MSNGILTRRILFCPFDIHVARVAIRGNIYYTNHRFSVEVPDHLHWLLPPHIDFTQMELDAFNSRFFHGLYVHSEHDSAMDIAGRQATHDPLLIQSQELVFNSMFFDHGDFYVFEDDDDSADLIDDRMWLAAYKSCKKKFFLDFDLEVFSYPIDLIDANYNRIRNSIIDELQRLFLSYVDEYIFPFSTCSDVDILFDVIGRYRRPYFNRLLFFADVLSNRDFDFRFGDIYLAERIRFYQLTNNLDEVEDVSHYSLMFDNPTLMQASLIVAPFSDLSHDEFYRVYNDPPIYLNSDALSELSIDDSLSDSLPDLISEDDDTCSCTNSSESDVVLLDKYVSNYHNCIPDDFHPLDFVCCLDRAKEELARLDFLNYLRREEEEEARLRALRATNESRSLSDFMSLMNTIPYTGPTPHPSYGNSNIAFADDVFMSVPDTHAFDRSIPFASMHGFNDFLQSIPYIAPVQASFRIVEQVEDFIYPFFELDDDEFNDCVMSDRVIYQWFDTIDKPPPNTTYLYHYSDTEVNSKKLFFGELLTDEEISYRDPVTLSDAWELYKQTDFRQYEILVRIRSRDSECAARCNKAVLDHYLSIVASPTSKQVKLKLELDELRRALDGMPTEVELNRLRFNDKYRLDLKSRVSSMMNVKQESLDDFVKLCEDIALSFAICSRSYSMCDIFLGLTTLVKLRLGNKPLFSIDHLESINDFIRGLIDSDFREDYLNNDAPTTLPHQSVALDTADSILERARYVLDRYHTIHTKPLVKKVMKCIMTVLSRTFTQDDIKEYNASLWAEFFPVLEQKVSAPSLIFSIADASVYVLERIVLSIKAGDASQMWAEGTTYQEWFETCQRLQLESKFLNDAERHGIDIHEFYKSLTASIKRGEVLVKTLAKFEYAGAVKMLNNMKEISHDRLGYEAGAEMRESPYSVCITGASNNMKTTLANIIHVAFCRANGKPTGPEYIYNRVLGEKHWTGFDSTKITVLYDDLACFLPEHPLAAEQINDLVHLNNNMPFTPPQASLDDKGRTHARNLLTIGSTNTPSLNLKLLFNNPYAFARRFDMYIDVEPKDKYRMEGENWLNMDPSKTALDTPAVISEYADYWTIRTYSVVPLASNIVEPANYGCGADKRVNQDYKFVHDRTFTNIREFIAYFIAKNRIKREHQANFLKQYDQIQRLNICKLCAGPVGDGCVCCLFCKDHKALHGVHKKDCVFVTGDGLSEWLDATQLPQLADRVVNSRVFLPHLDRKYTLLAKFSLFWWYYMPLIDESHRERKMAEIMINIPEMAERGYALMAKNVVRGLVGKKFYASYAGILVMAGLLASILGVLNMCFGKKKEPTSPPAVLSYQGPIHTSTSVFPHQLSLADIEKQLKAISPPPPDVDRPVAWPRKEFELTPFEIGTKTASWRRESVEKVATRLFLNSRRISVLLEDSPTREVFAESVMFGVCDHLYLLNVHSIKKFPVTIDSYRLHKKLGSSKSFMLYESQTRRIGVDVYLAFIPHFEPVADLRDLFASIRLEGNWPGYMAGLQKNGEILVKRFEAAHIHPCTSIKGDEPTRLMYKAQFLDMTAEGDCGSVWCAMTNAGPVLTGILCLGNGATAASEIILRGDLDSAIKELHPYGKPIQQGTYKADPYNLVAIHGKAPINFINTGRIGVIGSLDKRMVRYKTNIIPSLLFDELSHLKFVSSKVVPQYLDTYRPWHIGIVARVVDGKYFSQDEYMRAADQYLSRIRRMLVTTIKAEIVTSHVAINGIIGNENVKSLDFNTSAGFPHNVGKKKFRIGEPTNYSFEPIIMDEVAAYLELMRAGVRCNPTFTASPKDEVISITKNDIGKSRIFMGSPLSWVIAVRMVTLWLPQVMQTNHFVFECAAGMNVECDTWDHIAAFLLSKGPNMFAGDYKGFDEYTDVNVAWAVFYVIRELAKHLDASDELLVMLSSVGSDVIYYIVWYWNVLINFFGNTPSGIPITLLFNCIKNSLYFRCVYNRIYDDDLFDEHVAFMTMGDDNVGSVSSERPKFNHTGISKVFADVDITYTMADKDAESIPYVTIDDITFVKRFWRLNDEYGCYVCPIEEESIFKALSFRDEKAGCSAEDHAIAVIENALRQYSRYPRGKFDEMQSVLIALVNKKGLLNYATTSPIWWTYDDYINDWKYKNQWVSSFPWSFKRENRISLKPTPTGVSPNVTQLNQLSSKMERERIVTASKNVLSFTKDLRVDPFSSPRGRPPKFLFRKAYRSGAYKKLSPHEHESAHRVKKRLAKQINQIKNTSGDPALNEDHVTYLYHYADVAAGDEIDDAVATTEDAVISFYDEALISKLAAYPMRQVLDRMPDSTGFKNWFDRPLLIDTYTAQIADSQYTTHVVNPWTLYFGDAHNLYKLNNFAFFRGTLVLKVLVSATPFLYGLEGIFYAPLTNNALTGTGVYGVSTNNAANNVHITLLSQLQSVYITPQDGYSVEFEIPFIYNRNWLSLADTDATSKTNLTNFGALHYYRIVALQSANGATSDGVTFDTFCHVKDFEMTGPTTGLPYQSSRKRTEYDGPVSGPASAVAALASWFTRAPIIGKFATATQMGATALAAGAASLGFTNVPVIADIHSFRPVANPPIASTEIGFPFEKLTVDPKNELTVDNSSLGLGNIDEMNISYLCSKEALVQIITWSQASGEGTTLGGWTVNPSYLVASDTTTYTGQTAFYCAPVSYFSQLFTFWRGDIILRFKIIKSKYHRGRISIRWDPAGDSSTPNVVSNDYTNCVIREIIDISAVDEVEVTIPYMQPVEWSEVGRLSSAAYGNVTNGAMTFAHNVGQTNGTIVLSVMNELSAPSTSATVSIVVYARAGPNFELAGPTNLIGTGGTYYSLLPPQSSIVEVQKVVLGSPSIPKPERYLTNFGEGITTLRQLLRRITPLYEMTSTASASNNTLYAQLQSRFGGVFGFDSAGLSTAGSLLGGSNAKFNYNIMHPMHWVMCAFLGVRGSTNWLFNNLVIENTGTIPPVNDFMVTRDPIGIGTSTSQSITITTSAFSDLSNSSSTWAQNNQRLPAGCAVTDTRVQPTLAVTCPNYNNYFFSGTQPLNFTSSSAKDGAYEDYVKITFTANVVSAASTYIRLLGSVGIGTDFNLVHFYHVPPVYAYASYPTAQ